VRGRSHEADSSEKEVLELQEIPFELEKIPFELREMRLY
jgi:ADP-ribose pyrophosphatase YjhB (NUDIX family)